MGGLSIWHLLILGAVVLLLFGGKGKISDIMGDVAKGIKSFKKGLADDDAPAVSTAPAEVVPPRAIEHQRSETTTKVDAQQKVG